MIALAVVLLGTALALVAYVLLAPDTGRVDLSRRRPVGHVPEPTLAVVAQRVESTVDRALRRRGWTPVSGPELALAGIRASAAQVVLVVLGVALLVAVVMTALTGSVVAGLLLAVLAPVGARLRLSSRVAARRRLFGDQLQDALQLIAAALRAGHGTARAIYTVARESDEPFASELTRAVNENRIGRDLVEALDDVADRMQNDDMRWVAEAIAIQRATGGNLNEVLERVAATIRERHTIRREVRTLSAEGRLSAVILALLPFVAGGGMAVINPSAMAPLVTTTLGIAVLVLCALLFALGSVWMRAIVNVKV